MIQFDGHIFRRWVGWNHQPENIFHWVAPDFLEQQTPGGSPQRRPRAEIGFLGRFGGEPVPSVVRGLSARPRPRWWCQLGGRDGSEKFHFLEVFFIPRFGSTKNYGVFDWGMIWTHPPYTNSRKIGFLHNYMANRSTTECNWLSLIFSHGQTRISFGRLTNSRFGGKILGL